jgi:8-hydroxy-5-deazaflavin:NADPH oxidoreductase
MKIGMLGSGMVGRTLGGKLVELGHEVVMGSRRADNPEAGAWAAAAGRRARVDAFAGAAAASEVLFNVTSGVVSLAMLESCGAEGLEGKVLVDVSNPLDFSRGFPPSLSLCNTDSLGERIQASHPGVRVVKTFNTVSAPVMVQPSVVPGHHNLFLCGNDAGAKAEVMALQRSFGWPAEDLIDLGEITMARGTEMYMALWLRLFGVVQTPAFNINVVRGSGLAPETTA